METMTYPTDRQLKTLIIAQLRRDGNYDGFITIVTYLKDHSTTKTGWKL